MPLSQKDVRAVPQLWRFSASRFRTAGCWKSQRKTECLRHLRWFTPDLEMDLCGHATLASAHIAFTRLRQEMGENPSFDGDMLYFDTREGRIGVRNEGESRYTLDFPVREGKAAELPEAIYDSLSIKPDEVYLSRDYLLIYSDYKKIGQIEVCNRELFDTVDLGEAYSGFDTA